MDFSCFWVDNNKKYGIYSEIIIIRKIKLLARIWNGFWFGGRDKTKTESFKAKNKFKPALKTSLTRPRTNLEPLIII